MFHETIKQELNHFHHAFLLSPKDAKIYFNPNLAGKLNLNVETELKDCCENKEDLLAWYASTGDTYFDVRLIDKQGSIHSYRLQKYYMVEGLILVTSALETKNEESTSDKKLVEHNKMLTNTIPCGIFKAALDENFTILYKNQYFNEIFQYEASELKNVKQLILPSEYSRVHQAICNKDKYENKQYYELETQCTRKDGTVLWTLTRYRYGTDYFYGSVLDVTDRKKFEDQLRISEQEYRIAMRNSQHTLLRYHIPTRTISMEDPQSHALGDYNQIHDVPNCVKEKNLVSSDTIDDYMEFYQKMIDGIDEGETLFRFHLNNDIEYSWIKANYVLTYDALHHPVTSIISYQDYTRQHEQQIAYQRWIQLFEQQKAKAVAYYEYDISADRLETMESNWEIALSSEKIHSFTSVAQFVANHYVFPQDRKAYLAFFNREYLLSCYYQEQYQLTHEHRRYGIGGRVFWAEAQVQLIADPYSETIKAFVTVADIDQRKQEEIKTKHQLESDPLTGLYNRRSISDKVEKVLKENTNQMHAVIMLDLDHFKELNDKKGHLKGDEILCKVANIITRQLRNNDFCARIGGDEYVIFLSNIRDEEALEIKLERLQESLCFVVDDISFSASIGASIYPNHGDNFHDLYEKADQAMYKAKHQGRNRYHVFDEQA